MDRRTTKLEVYLQWYQKLKSFARAESDGTIPWLGSDEDNSTGLFSRGRNTRITLLSHMNLLETRAAVDFLGGEMAAASSSVRRIRGHVELAGIGVGRRHELFGVDRDQFFHQRK
jgi:hypothetical protein